MGEDYGYQDPEVEIKESGDVDFVEFTDSIADGKDHSVTFYDIAPEGSVMLYIIMIMRRINWKSFPMMRIIRRKHYMSGNMEMLLQEA